MKVQYLSVLYVLEEFLSIFWNLNLHGRFIKTWQCLVDNLLYQFLFDTFQWCHSSIHSFIYWFGDLSSSSSLQSHTKCSFSIYNWSNLEKNKFFLFFLHTYFIYSDIWFGFILDVNDVHEFDSVMSIWLNSISGERQWQWRWMSRQTVWGVVWWVEVKKEMQKQHKK